MLLPPVYAPKASIEADKAKFNELCDAVTDYYDGMEYGAGFVRTLDQTSIDENTADLGGIARADT